MKIVIKSVMIILFVVQLFSEISTADTWTEKTASPETGGYGEAVVGTGTYIYIVKCYNATSTPDFWRYDPSSTLWSDLSISGLPDGVFRNGTAIAWDANDYFYVLAGARYSDSDRREFYRYSISSDLWSQMTDSPSPQGAGDAITWSGYDDYLYAIMGSSNSLHGMAFALYDPLTNIWTTLNDPPDRVDDGCSLAWTGNSDLYALRGEYYETSPLQDFWSYSIPNDSWSNMTDIPDVGGVGDGGSLLWIGSWLPSHSDYIYALGGGSCTEDPGYDYFRYSISGDSWELLADLPNPEGNFNGCRLGFAEDHIYYWQGGTSGYPDGGKKFYMYNFSEEDTPTPLPIPTSTPLGLGFIIIILSIIMGFSSIRRFRL